MRITVYKCDECGKVLSDEKTFQKHLNLDQSRIQYVTKVGKNIQAISTQNLLTGIKQFCNALCLSNFINSKITAYEQKEITGDDSDEELD